MRADLHVHTRYSDGSYTVAEALCLAAERGLHCIGIVDHDNVAGIAGALASAASYGVAVVGGVEVSAYDFTRRRKVHILGYNLAPGAPAVTALCAPLLAARHANTLSQIDTLAASGYPLSVDSVVRAAAGAPVLYKQHIMAALVAAGVTKTIYGELYDRLFKKGGIADRDIVYVDAVEAVRAVKEDGGLAVLGHPGSTDSYDVVPVLVEAGLDGIELYHESHGTADHARILDLAARYGLFLTGGSDDHGDLGSLHPLGSILSPESGVDRLLRHPNPDIAYVIDLVKEAGARLRRAAVRGVEVARKNGDLRDLVTEYDLTTETFLVDRLGQRWPDSSFITEERTRDPVRPNAPLWIIDPIDGTTNFAGLGRDFAISVARYDGPKPVFGLVYDVMADELYLGVAGGGAFVNGARLSPLTTEIGLDGCLLDFSIVSAELAQRRFGARPTDLAALVRGHRAGGSSSLSICLVARGLLHCHASLKLAVWDWAAAAIVLKEVGGSLFFGPAAEGADTRRKHVFLAAANDPILEGVGRVLLGSAVYDSCKSLSFSL